MSGIKGKCTGRNFIAGVLLAIGILSMAGCSFSIIDKQSGQEEASEDNRTSFYQEPHGDSETAVETSDNNNVQKEPIGNNDTAGHQKPSSENETVLGIENELEVDTEEVADRVSVDIPENLKNVLLPEEVMIDWTQDASYIYTLVHSGGNSEYGDTLLVLKDKGGIITRIYQNDFRDLMPWKIEIADIDGDAEIEILVAVKKTTHYDKVLKNRMFIFNYRDNVLVKKWTGSQIAGTWRDFYAEDLLEASGEELIFLEQTSKGLERIKVYYWFDFGFFLLAESGEYTKVKELIVSGENSLQVTLTEGRQMNLIMKDGKLVETE